MKRKTKIIATIGPSSKKGQTIKRMSEAGMDIARINTKYGNKSQYKDILSKLKKVNCEVLFDIKDTKYIDWIKEQNFDYIALSYARNKTHVKKIKKLFLPKKIKIISKIETSQGLKNLSRILDESYGVMIARGDLGKNISLEKVPVEQKITIKKAKKKKVFTIIATEMLTSLVKNKTPERSEVSDIANSVFEGVDAMMLSEESAIGKYPTLAVSTMNKIILYTEKNMHKANDLYKF